MIYMYYIVDLNCVKTLLYKGLSSNVLKLVTQCFAFNNYEYQEFYHPTRP